VKSSQTNYLQQYLIHALEGVQDQADLKIVVVPSAAAAAAVRTAVARSGVGMVNLEAVTPMGLAFHVLKALDPIRAARSVSPMALECVLAAFLSQQDTHPASSVFLRSVPALSRAIGVDRLAGRTAAWVRKQAKGSAQEVYAGLFASYESYLEETGQLDNAAILSEATALASRFSEERHLGLVLVASETPLIPAQVSLLQSLSQGCRRALLGAPEMIWPDTCAARALAGWTGIPPHDGMPPYGGNEPARPRILQAATRREEVLMALQDVRSCDVAVSDVVFAVTDREAYEPLIRALAKRLNISVSIAQEEAHTRFVRFVVTLLAWMHSADESLLLTDLLRSGALRGYPDAHSIAAALDAFPVTVSMLDRPEIDNALRKAAKLRNIPAVLIAEALSFVRDFKTHRWPPLITPARALDSLRKSTKQLWFESDGWAAAWEQIEVALADLQTAPEIPVSSRWLATRMSELLVRPQKREKDAGTHVLVCTLDEAGYGPRAHVWVLGLDDKAVARSEQPPAPHIAGMETVTDLSSVVSVRQRIAELRRRIGENLTLCAPAFDVEEGRSLFPSSALIAHADLHTLEPTDRIRDLDDADAYIPRIRGRRFEGVESGLEALAARRSNQWTDWDGIVNMPAAESDTAITISASQLEMMASCPFKFWLAKELKVPVAPKAQSDWLSASDTGQILHGLFEEHTRSRMEARSGNGPEEEEGMLLKLREALSLQAVRSESGGEAAVAQRYKELAHAVAQYFRRERRLEDERSPVHVEFPIHDPNDSTAPVVHIDLASGRMVLKGRIDRIDETTSGSWVIVDYKTGSWKAFAPARLKTLEAKLQWAIYSLAAVRLTGRVVEKSEYVFTSSRGAGWVSAVEPPPEETLLALLDLLLRRYRAGAFIQVAQKGGACAWCDFEPVCGDLDERKEQLRDKFEHGDARMVELFKDWSLTP